MRALGLRWVVVVAVALGVLLGPLGAAPAIASKEQARESYRRATQQYKLAEYRQALATFKQAYREYEDPAFLYNIGQCHRMLGEAKEALWFYRQFLHEAPAGSPVVADVKALIAQLEEELARRPPPTPAGSGARPATAPGVAAVVAEPPPARPAPRRNRKLLATGLALIVAGALLPAVGGGTWVAGDAQYQRVVDPRDLNARQADYDRATALRSTSTVLFAVGGASLAMGVLALTLLPRLLAEGN